MPKPTVKALIARSRAEPLLTVSSGTAAVLTSNIAVAPKETAADFAKRELQQVIDRMEVVSNRLSSAKKRLQEHFGVPVVDSVRLEDRIDPRAPAQANSLDSIRCQLDALDGRFRSVADGMEELI